MLGYPECPIPEVYDEDEDEGYEEANTPSEEAPKKEPKKKSDWMKDDVMRMIILGE